MEAVFSSGGSTDWGGGGVDGGGGGGWSDGGGDIGGSDWGSYDNAYSGGGDVGAEAASGYDHAQAEVGEFHDAGNVSWTEPGVEEAPAEPANDSGLNADKFGLPENPEAQGYVLANEDAAQTEEAVPQPAAEGPHDVPSDVSAEALTEAPEGEALNWCPVDATGETADGPVKGSVTVRQGQGVLSALQAAGVPADKLNAAYGSLVASGQLVASDFKNGTPIVQPGREFQLNSAEFTDSNSKLGGSLIGNEHAARVVADLAPVLALTHATPEERAADPNYQLMRESQDRQNAYKPAVPAVVNTPTFTDNYQTVRDGWDNFKDGLRAANEATAISDGGGLLTAGVAFTQAPRELGFALVDAGLGLGGMAIDFTNSVLGGTLIDDAVDTFGPIANKYADIESKRFRISVGYKNSELGVDGKVMLGTDRVGIQYKTPGVVDEVTRFTYAWGDSEGPKFETLLEKNFDALPPIPARIGGVPIKIDVVPGLRENVTSGGAITPSINVDVSTPALKGFKGTIEVRQSGS